MQPPIFLQPEDALIKRYATCKSSTSLSLVCSTMVFLLLITMGKIGKMEYIFQMNSGAENIKGTHQYWQH